MRLIVVRIADRRDQAWNAVPLAVPDIDAADFEALTINASSDELPTHLHPELMLELSGHRPRTLRSYRSADNGGPLGRIVSHRCT